MARRSILSNNWRVKSDAQPQDLDEPLVKSSRDTRQWGPSQLVSFKRDEKYNQSSEAKVGKIRGEDDPRTLQAIAEGRRLYVGNMPYMAKTRDVEALFEGTIYRVEHINMSIDPFTARNPSYYEGFVELETREQADRAIRELNGKNLLGRPVKLGPGVAKAREKIASVRGGVTMNKTQEPSKVAFDRWTRTDAPDHWTDPKKDARRVIVSGLPRMPDHHAVNEQVRVLFKGYTINAISKVIVPSKGDLTSPQPRDNRYLFVDFATAEEAARAVRTTNGVRAWDVKIRVRVCKAPASAKVNERAEWEAEQLLNEKYQLQ